MSTIDDVAMVIIEKWKSTINHKLLSVIIKQNILKSRKVFYGWVSQEEIHYNRGEDEGGMF